MTKTVQSTDEEVVLLRAEVKQLKEVIKDKDQQLYALNGNLQITKSERDIAREHATNSEGVIKGLRSAVRIITREALRRDDN